MLRENAQVRHALQQKYRHLFVDEFQDTDPVQAEIVFLLAAEERRSKLRLQSAASGSWLPRFRRTGPHRDRGLAHGPASSAARSSSSAIRSNRSTASAAPTSRSTTPSATRFSDPAVGRVVPLTMNFRSVPALCEWANDVFDGLFPTEPTQHSPRFARLDPHDDD